jgi:putative membrane protein
MSLALAASPHLQSQSTSDQDKHFVTMAIEGNNDEISLAKLAQEKGSSNDVKQFAQKMINDHTKMGEEMSQVAQQIGVSPPSGTSMDEKAVATKLRILSGASFDKAYIQEMVKDHREDLDAFNKEAANGSNPAVKDAARSGAKVISSHLKLAVQIAANNGINVSEMSQ